MLKYTKIELELLTDFDKIAFIRAGIRGGVSQCSNRYAKANNQYLTSYDETKCKSFLAYFDANNLYGWAMSQYLPVGGFEWVDPDTNFNIPDTSEYGFILEVDLKYPDELHDLHSDLPLCPKNICVGNTKNIKLVPNLNNKTKYKIHYRNLKQCLKLVFGKTMENIEKRVNVKLLTHWENRNYILKKFGDKTKLLYTDTDSFIYQFFTDNLYDDLKPDLMAWFDTSNYPPDNLFGYPKINKKKLEYFKDENNGDILEEFVGLRSKMYAFTVGEKFVAKAKGVNKSVTKKLELGNYKSCLFNKNIQHHNMYRFRSIKHTIFTQEINKTSLSYQDTKRYILPNQIDTLAWGHYKLRKL
ncbi:unnamed protein product [Euphydryas editha]|uniref:DNA-directed DNA polymerase n=1 Tax=Euphydryas editha TaxID=104508 RepID=A0AAU9V9W5_EUPED|nr:unnamed protein product [Euphydryas editha]